MKPIRVEIRIKNNLLYSMIMKEHTSVRKYCRKFNLPYVSVCKILSFKEIKRKNGNYTKTVEAIALTFQLIPEMLFPDEFDAIQKNTISFEANSRFIECSQPQSLIGYDKIELQDTLKELLDTLTKKERDVINLSFGLNGNAPKNLKEIGEIFSISPTRIYQIKKKAIRRLRHPSRSNRLNVFIEDIK